MRARPSGVDAPFWLAAALLLLCCGVPLLALLGELASATALTRVQSVLGAARPWQLLASTSGLALVTTACALGLGVPLGVLLGRYDVIGRRSALWLHLFPLFLPPFLIALGWFHLLGRGGLVGGGWSSGVLFSPVGLVACSVLTFAPVVTALTALALQGIEPSLEEAARTVAPPGRVVGRILLPLCWRSIALGALVVFALSLSEVAVPMFFGVRTYSAAVFARVGGLAYAPGEAVALVLPLFGLTLALVWVDRRLIGRRAFTALGARSARLAPVELGAARVPVSAAVWLVIVLALAPLCALVGRAGWGGLSQVGEWVGSSVTTSLLCALAAASGVALLGVILGHALARDRRVARALDALALLAFMTPSAVLGVGLIATWNRPGTQLVYGTAAILVLGLSARYAAVGVRVLAAQLARSSPHHEEAAACFGAGPARRLLRIVTPMHARAIAGAWLAVLVFALRDVDTLVVFYPPGLEPLPVRIFTLEANGPEPVVAALAVLQVALTAALLSAGGLVLRARRAAA